jgi:ATP-dependent Lon protease
VLWSDLAEEEEDDDFDFCLLARHEGRLATDKKAHKESVVSEFNNLLASQMTAQRRYYEERQNTQEQQHTEAFQAEEVQVMEAVDATRATRQQLTDLIAANDALEAEIEAMMTEDKLHKRQIKALEAVNDKISKKQQSYEEMRKGERDQQKMARQQRDREVEELQQQIRELELHLQMQRRCEATTDRADIQGSHLLVTEREGPAKQRGRGGRRRR